MPIQLLFPFFIIFFSFSPMAMFAQANGAIASGHPLATKAGLEVLEKGGNAFDAAIAVAATLNVVEPAMSGLGGYGTTLIYDAQNKKIRYLNSSGKFPIKTDSDFMRAPTPDYLYNRQGPKSISTPSNLNGWQELHKCYGKMPWSSLFEHAIQHAKEGFPVSPYIAKLIATSFDKFSDYSKSFYGKNGSPLKEGELLVQTDLGTTYELIALKGVEPFYHGEIAQRIDHQLHELGSFLSLEDLRADVAEWWDPLKINYRGYDIYTAGTPGNSFTALLTLGVMEQFPVESLEHNSSEYLHILAEALKESCRARLTHPGSAQEQDYLVNHLLTTKNFVSIAHALNMTLASNFETHDSQEGFNTTHFVVVDRWGNVVSSTQTLGLGFGSKVMIEGTGIWMNNSMAFATFEPKGNPMDVFAGCYKLSSNSPIIIMENGKPWAALGTPGGHTIPQNIAQIVINLVDFGMKMQEAIDAPKIAFFEHHQALCTEPGISSTVICSLEHRGHFVDNEHIADYIGLNRKIGNAMGIQIFHDQGEISFQMGVDRRKDGWSTTHLLTK